MCVCEVRGGRMREEKRKKRENAGGDREHEVTPHRSV